MAKNKRTKLSQTQQVPVGDFFAAHGFKTYPVPPRPTGFAAFARGIGSFIGIVIVAAIIGVLLTILPLLAISSTAKIAEPAVIFWKDLPSEIGDTSIAERNRMFDANGNVFAEFWFEDRIKLESIEEISPYAINALVATEDKRFYEHEGYDPIGMLRSLASGSGGGSGITQQTVKNELFYDLESRDNQEEAVEYSLERKIKELKLAINYDNTHTKDEILLTYFNTVSFGSPTVYSIELASNYFFNKSAKDLTLAEAATLVGTVQNPTYYNLEDEDNYDLWKQRQKNVLERMVSEEYITQEEADAAAAEELNFTFTKQSNGSCSSSTYPFYCEYVLETLRNDPRLGDTREDRDAILTMGGLDIQTYMNPDMMNMVNSVLMNNFGQYNRVVAPTAVVTPGTGAVEAIGVNREYGDGDGETQIVVADNPTGTGSTFKIFTLAAAIADGYSESDLKFSSRCPLYDANYDMPEGGVTNSVSCSYQGGLMDYKQATAVSSNTWYTELIIKIGVQNVKNFASSVGLSAPDEITDRSVSYTLGVTDNSPIDMAAAFATFANDGIYCPATPIKSFAYSDGTEVAVPENYDPSTQSCKRVLTPKGASTVLQAMRAVIENKSDPERTAAVEVENVVTVGKSGTNQLYNLAWEQLSGDYSMFVNVYDMVKLTNEVEYVDYKGDSTYWTDNVAMLAGGEIMKNLIGQFGVTKQLNLNSTDNTWVDVPVETRDFFTLPSVIGLEPSEAVEVLESLGVKTYVSKDTVPAGDNYPAGVIVQQSIEPATKLPVGTKQEVTLTVSN